MRFSLSWYWWYKPVLPGTLEAEAGCLKFKACLDNLLRSYLKNKKKGMCIRDGARGRVKCWLKAACPPAEPCIGFPTTSTTTTITKQKMKRNGERIDKTCLTSLFQVFSELLPTVCIGSSDPRLTQDSCT